jgi:hypothetical protein
MKSFRVSRRITPRNGSRHAEVMRASVYAPGVECEENETLGFVISSHLQRITQTTFALRRGLYPEQIIDKCSVWPYTKR